MRSILMVNYQRSRSGEYWYSWKMHLRWSGNIRWCTGIWSWRTFWLPRILKLNWLILGLLNFRRKNFLLPELVLILSWPLKFLMENLIIKNAIFGALGLLLIKCSLEKIPSLKKWHLVNDKLSIPIKKMLSFLN